MRRVFFTFALLWTALLAAQSVYLSDLHPSDYGRAPQGTDGGARAKIGIYQRVRQRPAEELDIARPVVTAIVSLLTTVVGFHFRSRMASQNLKADVTAARKLAAANPVQS